MRPSSAKFTELPRVLQVAFALFLLHLLVYAGCTVWAITEGVEFHFLWIVHIGIVFYLLTEVRRPAKGLAYTLAGYCFIMPLVMLRGDYLRASAASELSEILLRSLPVEAPLVLAGVCILLGRAFYVQVRNAA